MGVEDSKLLDLAGDETVLEAGCGTGRDTARMLERLPNGRVIALDGSARMLERLRLRLAGQMDRIEVVQADLSHPLPLKEPLTWCSASPPSTGSRTTVRSSATSQR